MEERRISERPPQEVEDASRDVGTHRRRGVVRGNQALWGVRRGRRTHARHLRGRVLLAARPERVRQDDDAAHDRRLRRTDRGRYLRRRGPDAGGTSLQEAGKHRLPVLRHLPPPQRLRQRGLRARVAPASRGKSSARGSQRPARWCSSTASRSASRTCSRAASSRGSRSARALVNRPKVLLLDEPLGALDLKLRKEMQLVAKRSAARGRDHLHLRHPRPGRGAHHERQDRGDERG